MGKDDLKLQLNGKYRIARNFNLYAAYTQTMFWSIFSDSQPFKDINYNPEAFYRIVELDSDTELLKSVDIGYVHRSNGKDGLDSRSINRVFVKTNLVAQIGRHDIVADLMFYKIIDGANYNSDSRKYMENLLEYNKNTDQLRLGFILYL